jgi:DNA primase
MAGRIPQAFIDELVARTDIVELIGSRVALKKSGREYKACCPFHGEKTPSFWVSPDKQFYHCFGCGAHGTALGFLMAHDRMEFLESVEELAQRAGLEVPREAGQSGDAPAATNALYSIATRVAKHWADLLLHDERALGYARGRGLTTETLHKFMIGYAANSWNDVTRRFGTDEAGRTALAGAGVVIERDAGAAREGEKFYDRFRDRLMFPIRDARGRVIAFGGRIIDAGEPKYLNSPETALFHKGRELYGLFEARQDRAPLKRLVVVEGYMDVVRLHQAGIAYSVATLGTATTAEHLKRIFRLVGEVVFAFDGDRAGRAAAWRALQNALPEARAGREIKFLFLPEGEDPDTLVAKEGREAFEARLGGAMPLSEYLVQELSVDMDLSHADGRARLAEAARPLIAKVPEGVYADLLLNRIAEVVRLTPDRLGQLWAKSGAGGTGNGAPGGSYAERTGGAAAPRGTRMDGNGGPALSGGSGRNGRTGMGVGRGGLMRQAVIALVHYPAIAARVSPECVALLALVDEPGAPILRALLDDLRENPCSSTAQLLERWRDKPEGERFSRLAVADPLVATESGALAEFQTAVQRMSDEMVVRRIDTLLAQDHEVGLSLAEKDELKLLMKAKSASRPAAPPR